MNRDDIKEFLELAAGFKKSSRMLVEEEEDDPFAEEGGDEGGEEDPFAEEGGEEGEGEEGGDEEEEEEEEEVEVTKDDEIEFSKSLDNSLNALFIDIETDALKSAKVQEESFSLRKVLLAEAEGAQLDVDLFAAETARIIKNADVLLDIEQIVLSKARDYLLSKYDEEIESKFLDLMKTRHNIDHRTETEKEETETEIVAPIAVGAQGAGGGGV